MILKQYILTIPLYLGMVFHLQASEIQTMELKEWKFRKANSNEQWLPAVVPGCTHLSLLKNNKIEDPFWGTNEKKLQWIEKEDWDYRTEFDVDAGTIQSNRVVLFFESLDTYTDVVLNGKSILKSDNQFRSWEVDVKNLLKPQGNVLSIRFFEVEKIEDEKIKEYGLELPGGKRVYTRKAQYHYGWDWGPRYVTSGIAGKVFLKAWNKSRIKDFSIQTLKIQKEHADLKATFSIENAESVASTIVLTFNGVEYKKSTRGSKGEHTYTIDFKVPNPNLWWIYELGKPFLYESSLKLVADSQVVDDKSMKFGIRKIELIDDKDDSGQSFYFKLNNVPVFMKGANYIPQESFYGRLTDDNYHYVIEQSKAANMNMLRVWGGGLYEKNIFYDLCDEEGILVWQDFMFACAMYPANRQMLENIEAEADENIRRLRSHPCIALWCGNNEVSEAWHHWGWQEQFKASNKEKIWGDYKKVFQELLPDRVKHLANGVPYWESSPKFGRGNPKHQFEGDAHYWGVWHDAEPFERFEEKIPRFMSEYGFQGFPAMSTIATFSNPEDRKISSDCMLNHQKHPRGNSLVTEYMMREFPKPKDFDNFVYFSQILQAEGIRKGMEAHRRARPNCMGTLYWQLNDCWPVVSWSSMDYTGKWKALHYYAKKSYAPIAISAYLQASKKLDVWYLSDKLDTIKAKVVVQILDMDGKVKYEDFTLPTILPLTSASVYQLEADVIMKDKGLDPSKHFIRVALYSGDEMIDERIVYLLPPSKMKFDFPNILVQQNGDHLILSSNKLAKNVYLEYEGKVILSDNFFDLIPGHSKVLTLKDYDGSAKSGFKNIRSFVDAYE